MFESIYSVSIHRGPLLEPLLLDLLRAQLRRGGPQPAASLLAALQISQPTLSRLLARAPDVLVLGRARATRYALPRPLALLPTRVPLYSAEPSGPALVGHLSPLAPSGFVFEATPPFSSYGGLYDDLPWFLHGLRPSGFLGRLLARPLPGYPDDPRLWSTEDTLRWLYHHAIDTTGSFLLGDLAVARALEPAPSLEPPAWPSLAAAVMMQGLPGSSAAGEQPKLLGSKGGVPVVVKFSPPRAADNRVAGRIADLLWCEHVALEVLQACGVPAARSSVEEREGRVFLAVERFDRVRAPSGGWARRGLAPLEALSLEFGGDLSAWSATTEVLLRRRLLSPADHARAVWLERFGRWIGNTDMHHGNLSVFLGPGGLEGLAPAYDMLPMRFAPRGGELVAGELPLPVRVGGALEVWEETRRAALLFWSAVAGHPAIGEDMRQIAQRAGERIAAG